LTNLLQRTVAALILIPLLLALVHWGGVRGLLVPGIVVGSLAQWEFYRMFPDIWKRLSSRVALFGGALFIFGLGLMARGRLSPDTLLVLFFLFVTFLLAFSIFSGDEQDRMGGFPLILTGVIYIPVGVGMILLLRGLPGGEGFVVYLLGLTWIVDILGYVAGKSFGRKKLSPVLSPNKTWEGALAGIAGGLAWGLSTHRFLMPALSLQEVLFISMLISGWGQVGDLCESAFKRVAGKKDSGSIIPGHGGVLDRIDSLLFNSVALYGILAIVEGYSSRVWL
jgi:phosphatidate cytidylyltransferase